MPEEKIKKPRLGQAATEFNVSMDRIVDILKKKRIGNQLPDFEFEVDGGNVPVPSKGIGKRQNGEGKIGQDNSFQDQKRGGEIRLP